MDLARRARASTVLAAFALATLVVGARPGPVAVDRTEQAADPLDRTAAALHGLLARWEVDAHDAVFERPADARDQQFVAWFGDEVGACGPAALMYRRDAGNARYLYRCERGEIEAEFHLDADTGKIHTLKMGARGKTPPAAVGAAADDALALLASWDRDRFDRRFSAKFNADEFAAFLAKFTARWGACRIADVDLGSRFGALYDLDCERGPRLMKVSLGEDGTIDRFLLTKPFVRAP